MVYEERLIEMVERRKAKGMKFDRGLSDREIARIERDGGILFPPDLRFLLQNALPTWVDWRSEGAEAFRRSAEWIFDGICFDIEHNHVWMDSWGEKPKELEACFKKARDLFEQAPKMIPLYSHRFLPDRPNEWGNPVFSIHQTDIIYYGANLVEYVENEFIRQPGHKLVLTTPIKKIEFWTDFLDA